MIWIAFSLGLFGSLHCLGMCGPLALGYTGMQSTDRWAMVTQAVLYNTGRVISYVSLGVAFGLLSSVVTLTGFQNALSVIAGSVLILLFVLSQDLEKLLGQFKWYQAMSKNIQTRINVRLKTANPNPLLFGIVNGYLPCGMVYLALAGALTAGNIFYSAAFMFFFGMGTFPALFLIMLSSKILKWRSIISYQKVLPYVGLVLGLYLVFRGFMFDLPKTLDINFLPDFICH